MDKLFVARKIMKKAQVQIVSVILLTGITLAAVSGVLWWGLPMLEKSGTNSEVIQAIAVMQDIKTAVAEVSASGGSRVVNFKLKGEMVIDGASMEKIADGTIVTVVSEDRNNYITYTIITKTATSAINHWVPLDGFSPIAQELYTGNNGETITLPGPNDCVISNLCTSDDVDISCSYGSMSRTGAAVGTSLGSGYAVEYIDCTLGSEYVTISGPEKPITGFLGMNNAGVVVVKTVPFGDSYKTMFRLVYRELDDLNSAEGVGYLTQITKSGNTLMTASESGSVTASIVFTGLDRFTSGSITAEKTGGSLIVSPVTASFGGS